MDRVHLHFDDDSVGMLIEEANAYSAWLRRPDGRLYALRVVCDPWHLDQALELARQSLTMTQRVLVQMEGGATAATGVTVPAGLPLLSLVERPGDEPCRHSDAELYGHPPGHTWLG